MITFFAHVSNISNSFVKAVLVPVKHRWHGHFSISYHGIRNACKRRKIATRMLDRCLFYISLSFPSMISNVSRFHSILSVCPVKIDHKCLSVRPYIRILTYICIHSVYTVTPKNSLSWVIYLCIHY